MSANRSPRQARAAILNAPTADYAEWELLVSCRACDRPHVSVAVSTLGAGTVAAGMRRLRCSGCGGRPSGVVIANGLPGWRGRVVALEGDGAYS